jgi:nitrous oxidase accessory protein NosD
MTNEQKAAYVQAQAAAALIEAMGMAAENMQRSHQGASIAYDEKAFLAIIEKYGIHHNSVIGLFHSY